MWPSRCSWLGHSQLEGEEGKNLGHEGDFLRQTFTFKEDESAVWQPNLERQVRMGSRWVCKFMADLVGSFGFFERGFVQFAFDMLFALHPYGLKPDCNLGFSGGVTKIGHFLGPPSAIPFSGLNSGRTRGPSARFW